MWRRLRVTAAVAGVFLVAPLPGTAAAQEATEVATAVDEMWLVLAAALVMFMQPGFALVEAGFTRAKNAGNTTEHVRPRTPSSCSRSSWRIREIWIRSAATEAEPATTAADRPTPGEPRDRGLLPGFA